MTKIEFLSEIGTSLDLSGPLIPSQMLAEIADYDSLAILNLLSLFDSLGVPTSPEALAKAVTAEDLIAIAGDKLSDG